MGKQDYREAIENGRQEIHVHNNSAPSRRAHRKMVKEKPQKNRSILLPTLFFLFILIPVSLLVYVAFFYEPNDTLTASSVNNEVSLESLEPEPPLVPAALDEEEASVEQQADEEVEKADELQADAEEEAELQEKAAAKEKSAEAQAQREREQAEAKRQQEEAEAKRQQEAAEQKKQQEKQSAAKTHTVQPGETLYRIAVNTYGASGASAGVEKIKQANGLSSNEISVGATLVLP